ncbi:MAG: protease modulator HflC [Proteobacteria bacterium]|nr:protease modulator HflC [Pseudomonadota bacterium]
MNRAVLIGLGVVGVVALIVGMNAIFTVHQTQTALVLQLGNPVRAIYEAGLHFKLPFIQNVEYYDKRILDLDPPIQQVILSDRKRIDVDSFARYRIVDPLEFKKKAVTIDNFRSVFGGRLNSAVRAQVGKVGLADMVSGKRDDVMLEITNLLKAQEAEFGIEVVDVRIGRTDLPEDISNDVYNRMRSEREREASLLRAEGDELKQRIVADADRQMTIIIAEATRLAQILRGTGDAERNRILGDAYGIDPEFFAFYRSMEAYRSALGGDDTTMVLSPDSAFFRFFGDITGGVAPRGE